MADRYAVIGNPVEHSKSPAIHQAFALQTGQDIEYDRVLAPLKGFAETLAGLRASGYRGANVTVPFKFEACRAAQRLSERARQLARSIRYCSMAMRSSADFAALAISA